MVEAMFESYGRLLHALASDDDAWSWPLGRHLPDEQTRRRGEANATDVSTPSGLLHDGFLAWAARDPARTAVVHPSATLRLVELTGSPRAFPRPVRAAQ